MDSKQKYIEVEPLYEIEDWFHYKLGELTSDRKVDIISMMIECVGRLPESNEYTQLIAGVLKDDDPIYFEVEFYNASGDALVLMDIDRISSDEYLDYIIDYETIKSYELHTGGGAKGT